MASLKSTIAAASLASILLEGGIAIANDQASLWDGPAVTVYPKHEEIGPDKASIQNAIDDGRELFRVKFNVLDGAGRPLATGDGKPTPRLHAVSAAFQRVAGLDAGACGSCHNEPTLGGSGDFVTNTFVGAHFSDPPTLSVAPEGTNERNTITLFGSGLLERLAAEITTELQTTRREALHNTKTDGVPFETALVSKGISYGEITAYPDGYVDYSALEGIDFDLVVKPFGIKGIVISLREFTINALNQHHGIQAGERFGWERTGMRDFDGDGFASEFSLGQVTAWTSDRETLNEAFAIVKLADGFRRGPAPEQAVERLRCSVGRKGDHRRGRNLEAYAQRPSLAPGQSARSA